MRQPRPIHLHWVFSDSSAYYAAAVRRDSNYQAAQSILRALAQERARIFTTTYVAAETHALILNRQRDARGALALLDAIERTPGTTMVDPTAADKARARAILAAYQDHLFTLTDALSFAVMERLGITNAFSFDADFAEYGFQLATP